MSMGRGGMFGNPMLSPWEEEMERQRQRLEAGVAEPMQPQQAPEQPQTAQGGLLGSSTRPQGFWQGGQKIGGRDILAGILAAVGDGISQNSGGGAYAVKGLLGGRMDAQEMARKKAEEQAALAQQMAIAQGAFPGMNAAQQAAIVQKIGNPSDFKPPEPTEFERDMRGAGYDTTGPQAQDLYRKKLGRSLSPRQNLVMNPETGGMEWVTVPNADLPPPQPYDRVGGEYVPIPRLQPTPEEALAELRRRRGM